MIILPNLKGAIIRPSKIQKILAGGTFTSYNGTTSNRIAYLNTDGTIDSSFTTNGGTGFSNTVNAIAVQSDDKIICGGNFNFYNDIGVNYIARLNTDGTIDSSFTTGGGFSAVVYGTAVQSDGKIICGGNFNFYNGTTSNRIARLNTDGTIDSSFTTGGGTGFNNTVFAVAIQSNGKITCVGSFTSYNGTTTNRIARLNTDGTIDSSFTGSISTTSYTIAVQSDGKIICGGSSIARLNTDGTIDSSFNIGSGFNNLVRAIAIQSDGKIICGGNFTSYNGTTSNSIARLNSDGTIDSSFTIGTGFSNAPSATAVRAIKVQSNAKIICGGSFISYNGTTTNNIACLNSDGTIDGNFAGGTRFNNTVNVLTIK